MALKIPISIQTEHDELHAALTVLTQLDDELGEAARNVSRLLHPHFSAEETLALPPLAALGRIESLSPREIDEIMDLTSRLRAHLPRMLEEHKAIVGALEELKTAAHKMKQRAYAHFAEKLVLHARAEEEVLYPTALLIGDYLRLRSRVEANIF